MDIAGYCDAERIGNEIFFIDNNSIFSDYRRTSIYVPYYDHYNCSYDRYPCHMIGEGFDGIWREKVEKRIQYFECIKTETRKEKMHNSY